MVQVDGVEGQVLYGAGDAAPSVPVTAGQRLTEGTFAAAANGILYLSTFAGSELRLAEAGTLRFYGVEEPCPMADHAGRRSTFRLLGGKLRVTIRNPESPPHCYRIVLAGGSASVESGLCVMCSHGAGTYLFVARGATLLAGVPLQGAPREPGAMALAPERQPAAAVHRPAMLTGNGNVGWLGGDGVVVVQPLSAIGAAAQTCLLAGLQPDLAASGKRNPVDASKRPFVPDAAPVPGPVFSLRRLIVSPTQ